MKATKLFVMALSALTLFSCSKENANDQPSVPGGKAYMSISLLGKVAGRAAGDPVTGTGQDKVNDVHILYFDQSNNYLGMSKKLVPADFTATSGSYQTTAALEVPGATKKVFVIVNNYKKDGTTARFTLPLTSDVGRPWSALNQTLKFTTATADVNAFIADYTGTLADNATDNFVMANFGVRYTTGTTINTGDNGLVSVEVGKDATEAKTKNNTVAVDRLSSKVEFRMVQKAGSADDNEVAANPATAAFFFQGWELNATNRSMRLYAEHDANYTQADAGGVSVAYRKDANYTLASYGTATSWTEYKNQFVYLQNATADGTVAATSAVGKAASTDATPVVAYCPENTMEALAQVVGATTKAVVKGNYVPAGFAKGADYFSYDGFFYDLAGIQQLYADAVAASQTGGIITDMKDFLVAAKLATADKTDDEMKTLVAGLTAASFDNETGIIAREKNAVRFFHEGVSYYEVLVRHDARITGNMAFAKYGVVRNNWYTLTLNSVSRPGTPWIPGGPDDPTTKPETPDDNVAALDVTIKVNPWVKWSQLVDL